MSANRMDDSWVPAACTLPAVEQPLRRAEFDSLFASDVMAVRRESPRRLLLELRADPEVASRAAGLAMKEAGCCSFFAFDLANAEGSMSLGIETAPAHEDVLTALEARAGSGTGTAR